MDFENSQDAEVAIREMTNEGAQVQMAKVSGIIILHYQHQLNFFNDIVTIILTISSLQSLPYNLFLTISSLQSLPYNLFLTIYSLQSLPYNLFLTISSSHPLPYNLFLTISSL